jgi:hypothetical protein
MGFAVSDRLAVVGGVSCPVWSMGEGAWGTGRLGCGGLGIGIAGWLHAQDCDGGLRTDWRGEFLA